jgi:hypothetical protein
VAGGSRHATGPGSSLRFAAILAAAPFSPHAAERLPGSAAGLAALRSTPETPARATRPRNVSCRARIAERLAYFEDEETNDRHIPER